MCKIQLALSSSFSRPLKSVNSEKNGLATNRDAKLFKNFDSKFLLLVYLYFIVGVGVYLCI